MKPAIALSCVLGFASSAHAQMAYHSQARSVVVDMDINFIECQDRQPFHFSDRQEIVAPDFGPFVATLTLDITDEIRHCQAWPATVTAWQDSTLASSQIVATGGVRDVSYPPLFPTGESNGLSELVVEFDVSNALDATLTTIWEPGTESIGRYSLRGPSANLSGFQTDSAVDHLVLTPGRYVLSVSAEIRVTAQTDSAQPISYSVRLETMPIPEPPNWIAAGAAICYLWRSRRKCGPAISPPATG